jgi:hypothetical protein
MSNLGHVTRLLSRAELALHQSLTDVRIANLALRGENRADERKSLDSLEVLLLAELFTVRGVRWSLDCPVAAVPRKPELELETFGSMVTHSRACVMRCVCTLSKDGAQ